MCGSLSRLLRLEVLDGDGANGPVCPLHTSPLLIPHADDLTDLRRLRPGAGIGALRADGELPPRRLVVPICCLPAPGVLLRCGFRCHCRILLFLFCLWFWCGFRRLLGALLLTARFDRSGFL